MGDNNTFGISMGNAAAGTASSIGGAIMGLALGGINDRRQLRQQERLQELAMAGNKEMALFNYDQQMKMWEATNYNAQVEQLKKAGLNPALLYAKGGAGGMTNAAQAQGIAAGQAPQGGGEVQKMMEIGMQTQMMQSQIKLMEAQAKKANAEAEYTGGVQTDMGKTSIQSMTQGMEESKAKTRLIQAQEDAQEIDNAYSGATLEQKIANYANEASRIWANARSAMAQADIDNASKETRIKQFEADLRNKNADTALKYMQERLAQSGIKLNDAQIQNMKDTQSFNRMALGQMDEKEFNERIQKGLEEMGAAADLPAKLMMDIGRDVLKIMTAGQAFKDKGGETYREGYNDQQGDWWQREYHYKP